MIALALIVGVVVLIALANGNGALSDNGSSLDLHGGFNGGENLYSPDLSYIETPAPETVTPATIADTGLHPVTYVSDLDDKERLRLEMLAEQIAPVHMPPPVIDTHKEDIRVEPEKTNWPDTRYSEHSLFVPGAPVRRSRFGGVLDRR